MGGDQAGREVAIIERHALYLKAQPTTLRRCLGCEEWMHSTGPDHRICNCCKGEPDFASSPVGRRASSSDRRKGVHVEYRD